MSVPRPILHSARRSAKLLLAADPPEPDRALLVLGPRYTLTRIEEASPPAVVISESSSRDREVTMTVADGAVIGETTTAVTLLVGD